MRGSATPATGAPSWPWAAIALWLALAVAAGATGAVARMRPPAPQLLLLALTVATIVAYLVVPAVRAWADTLDLRVVAAFHLTRLVGIYFLVLYARGRLPYAFAVPGGWGDIAAALGAGALALAPPARGALGSGRRAAFLIWNVFGLLDILAVVATAARLGATNASSLDALVRLPLSILPTFLVPLIVASHLLVFARLSREARGAAETAGGGGASPGARPAASGPV